MRIFIGLIFSILVLNAQAKKLEAYFSYATFFSPDNGPYIETYLSIVGQSISQNVNVKGKYQGQVEVVYIFYQGEEVRNFKKFNLLSPAIEDTSNGYSNFLDQQRILLENGKYLLEIQITDLNVENSKPVSSLQEVEVDYANNQIQVSQIEFVESFKKTENPGMLSKSGYDIIPYVSDFYPENLTKIRFYSEIYNSQKLLGEESMYLIKYFIEKYESGVDLNQYMGFIRQKTAPVNVLLREFNIEKLPSGNYNLVVEVRNKENELLSSKTTFFQRLNPSIKISLDDLSGFDINSSLFAGINSRDSLEEYVNCIRPISDPMERNFIDNNIKTIEDEMLRKYFYSFWYKRNELTPEQEWKKYLDQVIAVDKEFGTQTRRGYETDRGRVYLQYGPPNQRTKRYNEPSSYPYEVWQYYKTKIRADSRFVFFNPNIGLNDFELLHSNVYGEIRDYRWQARLQKRNDQNPNLDDDRSIDHFGSEIDNFFENPR